MLTVFCCLSTIYMYKYIYINKPNNQCHNHFESIVMFSPFFYRDTSLQQIREGVDQQEGSERCGEAEPSLPDLVVGVFPQRHSAFCAQKRSLSFSWNVMQVTVRSFFQRNVYLLCIIQTIIHAYTHALISIIFSPKTLPGSPAFQWKCWASPSNKFSWWAAI